MADTTQFDHDRLSHLLADRLLRVPKFQRSYSWDELNIQEFLDDLQTARDKGASYFMGTVVFAESPDDPQRQQIVDGQQRLATTAVFLAAARDLLREYGKSTIADHVDGTYLQGYDIAAEDMVHRLVLNPTDQLDYDAILAAGFDPSASRSSLARCYAQCLEYLRKVAPTPAEYREIVEITRQLDDSVQVLVAVASDLPEAYVIFETLNDRGADLTTADLLKNYLFSQAKANFDFVEACWTRIASSFEKPEDLVKFVRYEYASRHGRTTTRKLYRAIQEDIGQGATNAKKYAVRLEAARDVYAALRDPDHARWNNLNFDVRDALLAYRRFGFESSMPVLLAAFREWGDTKAAKLLVKVTGWSVRAQFTGRIGGSLAEESFGDAAKAIGDGEATTQPQVRALLNRLIPSDAEFRQAIEQYGDVSVSRAKYLLAMLEKAHATQQSANVDASIDWSSKSVTIEHIWAKSSKDASAAGLLEQLGNMALLERNLNRALEDKPFADKVATYSNSKFALTQELAKQGAWGAAEIKTRAGTLAELACKAWPR